MPRHKRQKPCCKLSSKFVFMAIMSAISICLSVATLVTVIIFRYSSFFDSPQTAFVGPPATCSESYMTTKYGSAWLHLNLKISIVLCAAGIGVGCVIFIMCILAALADHRHKQRNPELEESQLELLAFEAEDQYRAGHILSYCKFTAIWLLLAIEAQMALVVFGHYISFFIDATKSGCQFTYLESNLYLLFLLAGIWLLTVLFTLRVTHTLKLHYAEHELIQQTRQKYAEMVNVTQQPENITHSLIRNQVFRQNPAQSEIDLMQRTKVNSNPSPRVQDKPAVNSIPVQSALKKRPYRQEDEQQAQSKVRQTYGSNDNQQVYHVNIEKKSPSNYKDSRRPYQQENEQEQEQQVQSTVRKTYESNDNQQMHKKQGPSTYKEFRDKKLAEVVQSQTQGHGESYQSKNRSREGSPVNNQSNKVGENRKRYPDEQEQGSGDASRRLFTQKQRHQEGHDVEKSPRQRAFNRSIYRAEDDVNKGTLVYHKRANDSPNQYKLNKGNSINSPQSRFVHEQEHYLRNNARTSILGAGDCGPRERQLSPSPGTISNSRRRAPIFDERSKNFQKSRYRSPSPGESRRRGTGSAKSREGVLTSFIRGRFVE